MCFLEVPLGVLVPKAIHPPRIRRAERGLVQEHLGPCEAGTFLAKGAKVKASLRVFKFSMV